MEFNAQEYFEMLLIYGECGRNARRTARVYQERFPNRRAPTMNVILRLVHRVWNEGVLVAVRRGHGRINGGRGQIRGENRILQLFHEEPRISVRVASRRLGISRNTVHRCLQRNRMHAFHFTRTQHLHPGDLQNRRNFCRWLLAVNAQDPGFIFRIIFSDETHFTRAGSFNTHNYHVWSVNNPHAVRSRRFQQEFSVNLWVGLMDDQMVNRF